MRLAALTFVVSLAPILASQQDWVQIFPGDDTGCGLGQAFSFFYRPGTPDKVVFELEGGGACWSEESCNVTNGLWKPQVCWSWTKGPLADCSPPPRGLLGESVDNALGSWTTVYVPYCTGDLHMGSISQHYSDDMTVNHFGARNVRAVLKWMMRELRQQVETMAVVGCSAGACASKVWAGVLLEMYPTADVAVFSDSCAGVPTSAVPLLAMWNATANIPSFYNQILQSRLPDASPVLYKYYATNYPTARFAEFSHLEDAVQIAYLVTMSGRDDLGDHFKANLIQLEKAISAVAPNYRYFLESGKAHCVITNTMYNTSQHTPTVESWVNQLVDFQRQPPMSFDASAAPGDTDPPRENTTTTDQPQPTVNPGVMAVAIATMLLAASLVTTTCILLSRDSVPSALDNRKLDTPDQDV